MQLPFFYHQQHADAENTIALSEETSKHMVSVLRMNEGEQFHLTDGNGHLLLATLSHAHKKHAEAYIVKKDFYQPPANEVVIAISLLKNSGRFEWFLEKATEIGVSEIVPLLCERTERQHFRKDRFEGVLISALLQSRQCWLPILNEPRKISDFITDPNTKPADRFIAHCDEQYRADLASHPRKNQRVCLMIGPEGDFTPQEIQNAVAAGYLPVSLGENRLRSETAGMVGVTLLNMRPNL